MLRCRNLLQGFSSSGSVFILYSLAIGKVLDPSFTNCSAGYWPVYILPFLFYGAINVKLFALLRESSPPELLLAKRITGFSNATSFAGLIFSFNLLSLVSFVAMTIYQALTQRRIDEILLRRGHDPATIISTSGSLSWSSFQR